jgi:hypothetical protein
MNFKSQATTLFHFLKKTQNIWDNEVMDHYPESLNQFNPEWIESLRNLTLAELHQLDSKEKLAKLAKTSLQSFLEEIKSLEDIIPAQIPPSVKLEDWAYVDIKEKKKHEINILAPFISNLQQSLKFNSVIDIGGGVGHLARIIAKYFGIKTISIDKEKSFQAIGKKRLERYREPINAAPLEFLNLDFSNNSSQAFKEVFQSTNFILGLHTCGELANSLIKTTIETKAIGLLNFGCCYHKMGKGNFKFNSLFFQENLNLTMTLESLTLATRAHGKTNFYDFETKYLVKNYRQALHLFLIEKFNRNDILSVGEIHVREYRKPFEDYLFTKLETLNISHNFTKDEMSDFYQSSKIQTELKKMFLANLIRWQMGRVLEKFLLLDRVIYLEENNYQAELLEFFTESISPRNIGILAKKLN